MTAPRDRDEVAEQGGRPRAMSEIIGRMTNVTLLDRPASTRTLLSAIQAALRSRARVERAGYAGFVARALNHHPLRHFAAP